MLKKVILATVILSSGAVMAETSEYKIIDCFSCATEKSNNYTVEGDTRLNVGDSKELAWCYSDFGKAARLRINIAKSACGVRVIRFNSKSGRK